jgi:hypothetical protein
MLDVHPAHHAATTWREFFIHIATIVIGLLIAVGLEQTVEYLHHRQQRQELEAAIKRDCEANREYISADIKSTEAVLDWSVKQTAVLEQAKPAGPLTIHRLPQASFGSPDAGVWPSAKASGTTTLLPPSAQNWVEYLAGRENQIFEAPTGATAQMASAYAAFDRDIRVDATQSSSREIDLSALPAGQRLRALDDLRSMAEQARVLLHGLLIYDAGNEYILSTPLDKLDTSEAEKRYTEILTRDEAAHPRVRLAFGGN